MSEQNIEPTGVPLDAEKVNAADESEVAMVTDEPTSDVTPAAPAEAAPVPTAEEPQQPPAPIKSEEAPPSATTEENNTTKHEDVAEKLAPKEATPEKAPAEPEKAPEPEKPAESEKPAAEPEKPAETVASAEKTEAEKTTEHEEQQSATLAPPAEVTVQKKVPDESGDQVKVKSEAKIAETLSIPPPSAQPQSEAPKEQSKQSTLPTRQYLDATVVPILHSALSQLAKLRPENPIEYLGKYLLEYQKDYNKQVQ